MLSASRTDAGVHAKENIVCFHTASKLPLGTIVRALNFYLPDDIAVEAIYKVDEEFDIRRKAVSREYEYRIWNGRERSAFHRNFSFHVPVYLNCGLMDETSQALIGEHDFSSFTTAEDCELKKTVKRIDRAGIEKEGDLIKFRIIGNSFLRHQVRNTVGALICLGQGKINKREFVELIEKREPGLAGPRAPAAGLSLIRINYPIPFGT